MAGAVGVDTPNDLMTVFSNTVTAGFDALQGSINGVFGLMITLVVALTGIQWALSSNREVLAGGFGKVLLIGAFAYLINDWHALSETLYSGFIQLGLSAGGGSLSQSEFLNPGAVLNQGWQIVKALGDTPAPAGNPLDVGRNLADALVLGLSMIGIMLAFGVLAIQIIVALLEFKIVTLAGFVLLPFGIYSKSAFLAERPLGYVVSAGLKVLAMAIVVSGARSVFDQLQPSATPDVFEALSILVAAMLLAMLAIFIPNLASALVTGGPALGAGAAATGALAVGGASLVGAGSAVAAGAGFGRAAASASASRAAAGAGAGRAPTPPAAPTAPRTSPPAGPRPSNDNPPPRGPTSYGTTGRPSAPGVSEPAAAWVGPEAGGTSDVPNTTAGSPSSRGPRVGVEGSTGPAPSADPSGNPYPDASPEMGRSRSAFRAALAAEQRASNDADASPPPHRARRSAALQTFFAANAGRSLFPGGESSGAISPQLRTEEP